MGSGFKSPAAHAIVIPDSSDGKSRRFIRVRSSVQIRLRELNKTTLEIKIKIKFSNIQIEKLGTHKKVGCVDLKFLAVPPEEVVHYKKLKQPSKETTVLHFSSNVKKVVKTKQIYRNKF